VWITQFYLQITPYLPLRRKRSPDGATTVNWNNLETMQSNRPQVDHCVQYACGKNVA